jgi:hypothetical protein
LQVAADVAALLAGQGRYDEAEALYRRALDVFERHLGPNHYEVALNRTGVKAAGYQVNHTRRRPSIWARV